MQGIDLVNAPLPPPTPANPTIHDLNFHLQESQASLNGDEQASEKAFKCFVRAVHALQSLDLQGDTVPQVTRSHTHTHIHARTHTHTHTHTVLQTLIPAWRAPQVFADSVIPEVETCDTHVLEDEQADLYCCWAESVLLKFRYTLRCVGCLAGHNLVHGCLEIHVQATIHYALCMPY